MPSYSFLSQSGGDLARFLERDHVAALGEVDERCRLAGFDRAALVAGGAEGAGEADTLALGVASKPGSSESV